MSPSTKFQLYISGKEYGPCTADEIRQMIADSTIAEDCLARRVGSSDWKSAGEILQEAERPPAPKKKPTPLVAASSPAPAASATSRDHIRANTAYKGLRSVINVGGLLATLMLCWMIYLAISTLRDGGVFSYQLLIVSVGMLIGTLISWGLAHVLVDIADVQLGRK